MAIRIGSVGLVNLYGALLSVGKTSGLGISPNYEFRARDFCPKENPDLDWALEETRGYTPKECRNLRTIISKKNNFRKP